VSGFLLESALHKSDFKLISAASPPDVSYRLEDQELSWNLTLSTPATPP